MDQRETLDHRRKQDRRVGTNPETRAEDVAERAVQAVQEVQDTIDSLNKEAKCSRPAFADPMSRGREPPDKISQGDEVIVSEYWFKRMKSTTTGMVKTTGSISTFVANAGAGGAVARAMLVWRVAMSSCSVRSQQALPSAGVPSITRKRDIKKSASQVDWRLLSAHRWVRQRTSHNRRTPQVTDHGCDVACSDESGVTAVRWS